MTYLSSTALDWNFGRYAAAPAVTADELQADYYLRALIEDNRELERRIGSWQTAMARYEATGDVDHAGRLRDRRCIERHEQELVGRMIDNLPQRFAAVA